MEDVVALQDTKGRGHDTPQTVVTTMDPRATKVVAPPTLAAVYEVRPSTGSRSGAKYRTAKGNVAMNQGEKHNIMRTEGGDTKIMTSQIADVI